MSDQTLGGEPRSVDRNDQMLLRVAASLLANRELTSLARSSDLSADHLRRELDAVGPSLCEVPRDMWDQYVHRVELHPVPGADPAASETVVPLWTEEGVATRWARVRLISRGADMIGDYWIAGFEDVVPPKEWLTAKADPVVPPEPLDPAPSPGERPVPERWRPVLWEIVHRLVMGDYEGLQRDGIVANIDDPEQDLVRKWIEEYHDPLVDLPENAWEWSTHGPAYDGPGDYWLVLSMWTAHQGLSLLSMEADVLDRGGDDIRVEVFSVHVM